MRTTSFRSKRRTILASWIRHPAGNQSSQVVETASGCRVPIEAKREGDVMGVHYLGS